MYDSDDPTDSAAKIESNPLQGRNKPIKTYSSWTGFSICINMIIGTGVFNLPSTFYGSGLILGVLVLSICAVFSWFCVIMCLEVSARTEGIAAEEEKHKGYPIHQITFRKFELNQLCMRFFGIKGKIFCQICMCFYCYGLLWAYGTVFASSVNSLFFQFVYQSSNNVCDQYTQGSCNTGYLICLLIYTCLVVPLSLLNIGEQAFVQVLLTCYRFFAFGVMIITLIVALATSSPLSPFPGSNEFKWQGFASVFTTSAVALNFHFCIPDLARPLKTKEFLKYVTSGALVVAAGFYMLVGVLCSLYFGNQTKPLVTLNWQYYTGYQGGWGDIPRPWWSVVIQLIVMLFPVFDMVSVFPIIGVTLGDNLVQLIPYRNIINAIRPGRVWCGSFKKDVHFTKIMFRFVATVPPLLLAAFLGSLDYIFKFTGLFAFMLVILIPCFLQLKSRAYCESKWGPDGWRTPYSMFISGNSFVWATIFFGVGALVFSVFDVVVTYIRSNFWS